MTKFIKRALLFFSIIIIVIAILIFIQPVIYRLMPSDFDRHLVYEKYVEESPSKNTSDAVIFGDSRAMFGIDTRIIKKQLHREKDIYNFASVGQNIYESSYFYSKVKPVTKLVIQCSGPSFFTEETKHNLPDPKAISMYLSGYRMDLATKKLIPQYNRFFDNGELSNYYSARSYFVTYLHNLLRPVFDDEVFDDKSRSSRFFPHHYTKDRLKHYDTLIKTNCDGYVYKSAPKSQLEFVRKSYGFFAGRNIKYVFVLMPVNPDVCNEGFDYYKKIAAELRSIDGLMVVDLSHLLPAGYFYDNTHVNKRGAKILSNALADGLRGYNF